MTDNRNIKLIIAYDGTDYCGWQKQKNGLTIQGKLEKLLAIICNQQVTLHGAGRTDAGVHALAMTANFHTNSTISLTKLQKGLNSLLPGAIKIMSLAEMDENFHSRFSVSSKTYLYKIFTGDIQLPCERFATAHVPFKLSLNNMRSCLEIICGCHDFASFETSGSRDKSISSGRGSVRTIFEATLLEKKENYLQFEFTGDGFLRHMIRNLVGTLLEVGNNRKTVADFKTILQKKSRSAAGTTAPAHGLHLLKIHY